MSDVIYIDMEPTPQEKKQADLVRRANVDTQKKEISKAIVKTADLSTFDGLVNTAKTLAGMAQTVATGDEEVQKMRQYLDKAPGGGKDVDAPVEETGPVLAPAPKDKSNTLELPEKDLENYSLLMVLSESADPNNPILKEYMESWKDTDLAKAAMAYEIVEFASSVGWESIVAWGVARKLWYWYIDVRKALRTAQLTNAMRTIRDKAPAKTTVSLASADATTQAVARGAQAVEEGNGVLLKIGAKSRLLTFAGRAANVIGFVCMLVDVLDTTFFQATLDDIDYDIDVRIKLLKRLRPTDYNFHYLLDAKRDACVRNGRALVSQHPDMVKMMRDFQDVPHTMWDYIRVGKIFRP